MRRSLAIDGLLILVILSACAGTTVETGPSVDLGLVQVNLHLNNERQLVANGEISVPIALGVVNWDFAFSTVLIDSESKSNYLIVIWDDGSGEFMESDFPIGQPFTITFENDQWVRRIEHAGDGNIVVGVEIQAVPVLSDPLPAPTETSVPVEATPMSQYQTGSTLVSPTDGMTLLFVPEGEFLMGSDNGEANEVPSFTIYVDAFWIDQTLVTNKMYAQCVAAGACRGPGVKVEATDGSYYGNPFYDDYPVMYTMFGNAEEYCQWAGRRLPTEFEWEKAARGTDGRTFPWGNDPPDANFVRTEGIGTSKVGSYPAGASPYGALDMVGNVLQWTADPYKPNLYKAPPGTDPFAPPDLRYRVLRGSAWYSSGLDLRVTQRTQQSAVIAFLDDIGFRCATSQP